MTDHLGNNRMVVRADGTVEQVTHYYPYGGLTGESTGGDAQPYKYNGKEMDRTNGLDWYDYGARHMDAALGRFTTMDPLCEKYYGISPYAYCAANPINFVDIKGDSITFVGNQDDINYSVSVLNNFLEYNYVQVDKNGILSENMDIPLTTYIQMNKGQELLFKLLRRCISSQGMTTIELVNNSEDVIIGNAALKQIDIGDIQNITKHTQDKLPFNATGALSHELFEQYLMQQNGLNIDVAHKRASGAESLIVRSNIPSGERNISLDGSMMSVQVYTLSPPQTTSHTINVNLYRNNIQSISYKKY